MTTGQVQQPLLVPLLPGSTSSSAPPRHHHQQTVQSIDQLAASSDQDLINIIFAEVGHNPVSQAVAHAASEDHKIRAAAQRAANVCQQVFVDM